MPPKRVKRRPVPRTPTPEEQAFLRELRARDAQEADARPGGFTLRDEANAIVAEAFRNGPLERFHREDRGLGRITGQEMKELMLNACETMESLLRLKESDPDEYALHVRSYNVQWCRSWER